MYKAESVNVGQSLTGEQVNNVRLILQYCESEGLTREQTAYVLATAWHESKLKPVREIGGSSKSYAPYFGRGFVQLTHKENYEKYGIADNPDAALEPDFAARILVQGMKNGTFTGRKLSDYINSNKTDIINARRIVNGVRKGETLPDKAELIKSYYEKINDSLQEDTTVFFLTQKVKSYPKTTIFIILGFMLLIYYYYYGSGKY